MSANICQCNRLAGSTSYDHSSGVVRDEDPTTKTNADQVFAL